MKKCNIIQKVGCVLSAKIVGRIVPSWILKICEYIAKMNMEFVLYAQILKRVMQDDKKRKN